MRERRTSRKRVGRGGRGEEGEEGNRLWRWGWAVRRDQELEKEVRMDERRVGHKSLAGTRARGREVGREGGGESGASVCVLVSWDVAVGRDPAEGYCFVS